ncbi:hypothetical protein ONZ45_g3048 [Pleurotus djamor]|nr:hypothetical protein ONZ45_g3048 [Pleurotus djamor]
MTAGPILTSVCLAWLLLAEYAELKTFVWICKPLASCGFLLHGLQATHYDRTLFGGLCLAWIGDVLLIPGGELTFQAGLGSFLLGHLCYAISFYHTRFEPTTAIITLLPLAVIFFAVNHVLSPHVPDELQVPVLAYMTVISVMLDLAFATHDSTIIIGAILFYLSDFLVARDQFLDPGFTNKLIGLPLYYAGQLVIAWSMY